jgi:hypothetical protein
MSMIKIIIALVLSMSTAKAANTYYISKSAGADANTSTQATSKSTPWAHLPGMLSCGSNCASYTPVAGDTFVLKGCDTWANSDLPILWNWSGSAGNPISITVDQTWFSVSACPSGWNRPIFDAQKRPITGVNVHFRAAATGNVSYVTVDSIEMKGLYSSGAGAWGQLSYVQCFNTCSNVTLNNLYLHGWNVVTDGNCVIASAAGATNTFSNSTIDGSDATGASPLGATCYALYTWLPGHIANNVFHDLANGIVGYGASVNVGGNLIYNIADSNAGSHPNAIETLPSTPAGGTGVYYIHDNVIHDHVGETLMFGNDNETMYLWNNIIYNVKGNMPEGPQISNQTNITFVAWNNTIVSPSAQLCFFWNSGAGGGFTAVTIQNNHCITSGGAVATATWNGTTVKIDHNILMTAAQAAAAGYTPSQFAFSPTSGASATVGLGQNLTGRCSGGMAGLCWDTTYGGTRTAVARPLSSAWDVGAYQLSSSQPQIPTPPSGLLTLVR